MRLTKSFLSGVLFMVFGGAAVLIASGYRMGTVVQMGPGYFPTMVGLVITLIGFGLAVRGFLFPETSEPVEGLHIRPLVLILAAVAVFGLTVRSWGLVLSVMALVAISRFAGREGGALELVLMLAALTVIPVLVFVYGLNIPFQMWPR